MSVERRYSKRLEVEFDLSVGYRGRRFPIATARDLSPDGMFIRIAGITLPSGTLVDVEFERRGRHWLIPAIVVHLHPKGIGVMFREPEFSLYATELHSLEADPAVAGRALPSTAMARS
jgi:hypothetical protein